MPQSSYTGPRLDESFVPATLDQVRRCPARAEYIELWFSTPEGKWKWCFPEPSQRAETPTGTIALTFGRYGVQAHETHGVELGPALPTSDALPMILAGAEVYVARRLVEAG